MLIPLTQVLFGAVFGNGATDISEDAAGVSRTFCYGERLFELHVGKPVAGGLSVSKVWQWEGLAA